MWKKNHEQALATARAWTNAYAKGDVKAQ